MFFFSDFDPYLTVEFSRNNSRVRFLSQNTIVKLALNLLHQDENCRRVVSVPNAFYGAASTESPAETNYRKRPFSSYNIQVPKTCF